MNKFEKSLLDPWYWADDFLYHEANKMHAKIIKDKPNINTQSIEYYNEMLIRMHKKHKKRFGHIFSEWPRPQQK